MALCTSRGRFGVWRRLFEDLLLYETYLLVECTMSDVQLFVHAVNKLVRKPMLPF
jgi:hypothetical protein